MVKEATAIANYTPDPHTTSGSVLDQANQIAARKWNETPDGAVVARAIHYKVRPPSYDKQQFLNTARALAIATEGSDDVDMPFKMVIKIAEEKGYEIEAGEVEAGMLGGYRDRKWGMEEVGDTVIVWQNRGEVSTVPKLPGPEGENRQVIPISQSLVNVNSQPEVLEVLEGIAVFPSEQPKITSGPVQINETPAKDAFIQEDNMPSLVYFIQNNPHNK